MKENTMQCPVQSRETAEQLLDYCARRLDAETTARLDRHVEVCAECQEFVLGQRMVAEALEAYERFTPSISDDFDRQLYARIEAEQEDGWWKRTWRRFFAAGEPVHWKPALTMAAACVMIAGGLLVRQTLVVAPVTPEVSGEEVATAAPAPAVEKQELESLNQALEDLEMLAVLGTPDKEAKVQN